MQCKCFTCSIHRQKNIDEQTKLFGEAIYYATMLAEGNYMMRQFKSLGYETGHLSDEGVEGEMAAIECDMEAYACGLHEIMPRLNTTYKKLVKRIYSRMKK